MAADAKGVAVFSCHPFSIDPFGKGSPIGSFSRNTSEPLFPWFSVPPRRDISVPVDY
jgi:hypothetical protein